MKNEEGTMRNEGIITTDHTDEMKREEGKMRNEGIITTDDTNHMNDTNFLIKIFTFVRVVREVRG